MLSVDHWFNCSSPSLVKNRYTGEFVQVPCGKCHSCKVRRITHYIPALLREADSHKYVDFFTLTYSDDYLPTVNLKSYSPDPNFKNSYEKLFSQSKEYIEFCNYNLPVLRSSDAQNFIKRLRENIFQMLGKRSVVRYFISGDYGSTCFRPHWHGLLFYDEPAIRSSIQDLFSKSWSVRLPFGERRQIGRFDCQPAYGAASYCSSYINTDDERPSIYDFRVFRPKALHSSNPPLGSLVHPLEDLREIVQLGLREITLYDPKTFEYRKTALTGSMLYRLFPSIPSYTRLSKSERFEIYRILSEYTEREPAFRRLGLLHVMNCNSFFKQYVTLGSPLRTDKQILDRLDRIYYPFKRLQVQASSFGVSIQEYDSYIDKFYFNCAQRALKFQLEYEDRFLLKHPDKVNDLFCVLDLAYPKNKRSVKSFLNNDFKYILPSVYDQSFLHSQSVLFNRLVKRKLDNSYLEKHPEYKQFHS